MKRSMSHIKELSKSIEYRTQLIGRNQRLITAINKTRFKGIMIGFLVTVFLVGFPIFLSKGGF